MAKESFKITFSGKKSLIYVKQEAPDLVKEFNPGQVSTQKRFFITDGTVASLEAMGSFIEKFDDDTCGQDILLTLGSGESYKNIDSVLKIIQKACDAGFTKNDMFIGIGGGVICELTSFAASIYKRGIEVQLVPTTLLSMIDASIGGKVSCDFDSYKSMIGTYYPASKIFCWPDFIYSQSEKHYKSGLAEAFKIALLFNQELYDLFKNNDQLILEKDKNTLEQIIKTCIAEKAKIVEKDLYGNNNRQLLNLGHTFGYALESLTGNNSLTHGETVAWGIGRILYLSFKKEYCRESFMNEVYSVMEKYQWVTTASHPGILGGGIGERFISVMHEDKKNLTDKIRLIILKGITDAVIEDVEDSDILSVLK